MGYLMRVRISSFFAGAAIAAVGGSFFLYKDYQIARQALSQQVKSVHDSLEARITALESLKEANSSQVEGSEATTD